MEVEKIQQLVLDKDAIALVVTHPGKLCIEARMNIRAEVQNCIKSTIPVLVLCDGLELRAVKASEAVRLEVNDGHNPTT